VPTRYPQPVTKLSQSRKGIGPAGKGRQPLASTVASALVFAVVLLMAGCEQEAAAPPTLEIPFIVTTTETAVIPIDLVGETIGSIDVTIRSRVDGFLDGIHFPEGSFVSKDDLLYTIDSQPFQAKLAQAKASYAQAQTVLAKSKSDLDRIRPLAEMKAVSEQDLDSAVANYEAAQSFVDAATAQVDLAELELGYTRIFAPVAGLIGLSNAQVGDFISQQNEGGLLNVVSRTDPAGVRVSIPEQGYLTAVRRLIVARGNTTDEERRQRQAAETPLTLILADGSIYEHLGVPTKVDRNIDTMTGSLTIEAEFPNPNQILRPGMFARIRFDADEIKDAVLVPQRAVNELQSAYRVFVILPDDTIEIRTVEVGQRLGSRWIITSGLAAGERVAVEGLLRLRPGMKVAPIAAKAADLPPEPSTGA
jgi:membrane fusion protein (multidrug efflux system)